MKALVIGATGIIGNHVVRSLLHEGMEVRVFSRGVTPSTNLENLDVERTQGDLNEATSLSKAIKGCNWIFHTAPYYPTNTFNRKDHLKKAMAGIATVLKVCADNSIDRLVYTSSLTTIGPSGSPKKLADETCSYQLIKNPPHPYFEVKYYMEEEVKKWAKKIPAVIVNPTGCFGPYELKPVNLCLIPQLINRKIPAYVKGPINVVDTADVGRGHLLAAKKGRVGERYILGGHNTEVPWVIKTICDLAKVKPPKMEVPLMLGLIPAWGSELLAHYVLHRSPSIPILGLRFIQHGQHFDVSKAKEELGYQISPMEPCFERAIGWYKKIGYC